MKLTISSLFTFTIVIVCSFLFRLEIHGQIKLDPFLIRSSGLLEEIVRLKKDEPSISPGLLADKANALLIKKGIDFIFVFNTDVCLKVSNAIENQKDKSKLVGLSATLNSVGGERTIVKLPGISFDKSECGKCFIRLPIFEISGVDFITSVQGMNIKFFTPSNVSFNQITLVNGETFASVRKWNTPFRTVPVGISEDLKLIYLELPAKELQDLVLIAYDDGAIQFYAKSDLDLPTKTMTPSVIPKSEILPNVAFVNLIKDDKINTLKYNTPCS